MEEKKKKNRRAAAKHPALQPKYNLRMRQDYIETEYVNGVHNTDGELVIRALNNEEKDFLNSFNEEVINANFMHDKRLRKLYEKMKPLKKSKDLTEEESQELMYLQMEYYSIADEVLLYPEHEDQKKLYGENNSRNRCLYNRTKSIGILDELNDCTYDEFHRNAYNDPNSGENLVINKVEARINTKLRKKKK